MPDGPQAPVGLTATGSCRRRGARRRRTSGPAPRAARAGAAARRARRAWPTAAARVRTSRLAACFDAPGGGEPRPGPVAPFRPVGARGPSSCRAWCRRCWCCWSVIAACSLARSPGAAAGGRARGTRPWTDLGAVPASGTEGNPLFPSADVSLPRPARATALPRRLAQMGEGTFFLETVVARDGRVSAVTLLDGDSCQARRSWTCCATSASSPAGSGAGRSRSASTG